MVVYRAADTPAGKMVDSIRGVKIVAGEDVAQDVDMSRQEYIDKMTPDEKKQLEDLKKANAEALQGQFGHQPAQRRPESRRPGQERHRRRQRNCGAGSGRNGFKGRHRRQGRRDQDRQVHRYREPDDQGHRQSSPTKHCCGPTSATGRPGSRSTTMPSRRTRRPSTLRRPQRSRACPSSAGQCRFGRDVRAHRQGS